MFNYPGSPDPKIWAMKKDLDAAFAKIKDLAEIVGILAKDVTFKVKFNSNTGSGTMSDLVMTGLGTATLPECTMTKTGHLFSSWNTKSDGTGRSYADESPVTYRDFKDESGDVTLYAQWAEDPVV